MNTYSASIEEIKRANRVRVLSKMTKGQLEAEERAAMTRVGVRRLDRNRMSKDELITSILYFEAQS